MSDAWLNSPSSNDYERAAKAVILDQNAMAREREKFYGRSSAANTNTPSEPLTFENAVRGGATAGAIGGALLLWFIASEQSASGLYQLLNFLAGGIGGSLAGLLAGAIFYVAIQILRVAIIGGLILFGFVVVFKVLSALAS